MIIFLDFRDIIWKTTSRTPQNHRRTTLDESRSKHPINHLHSGPLWTRTHRAKRGALGTFPKAPYGRLPRVSCLSLRLLPHTYTHLFLFLVAYKTSPPPCWFDTTTSRELADKSVRNFGVDMLVQKKPDFSSEESCSRWTYRSPKNPNFSFES